MTEPEAEDHRQFTKIPAGRHGLPPAAVVADQRARLHASMIILAADVGYPSTSVEALIRHAGVSRRTFYELYDNRLDCFIASCQTVACDWRNRSDPFVHDARRTGSRHAVRVLLRRALQTLVELVRMDARGAKTLFVESLNAGPVAQHVLAKEICSIARRTDRALFPQRGASDPSAVATAIVGGILGIVTERLRTDRAAELLALVDPLADWMLAYRSIAAIPVLDAGATSDDPARATSVGGSATADIFPLWREGSGRPVDLTDPYTRILRATLRLVGEHGYQPLSASAIQRAARVSAQTFRRYFDNKTEAFLTAYQAGNQATIDYALKAYTDAPNWPAAVRAGLGAELEFLARQPALARVGFIEVFAAGPEAITLRQRLLQLFTAALEPGYSEATSTVHRVTSEAVAGAIDQLIRQFLLRREPRELTSLLTPATFCALAPFVGPHQAAKHAVGSSHG